MLDFKKKFTQHFKNSISNSLSKLTELRMNESFYDKKQPTVKEDPNLKQYLEKQFRDNIVISIEKVTLSQFFAESFTIHMSLED